MPFPKQEYIVSVSQYLNKQYGHQYYIWNLSEHDYTRELFLNQVSMHSYIGFACPPLYELLLICKSILDWIQHQGNVAIIHCQQNKGRSAILLSIFWSLVFKVSIDESFYIIAKAIGLKSPLKSQLMYIHKYLHHLLTNGQLNTQIIKVKSVILSGIPKQFQNLKPLFQVLDRKGILYEEKNQIIQKNEQCIFILPNLQISNDVVFKCKHITPENDLLPIFRFQIHTGFLFKNIIRFKINDLDSQQHFDNDIYIDLVYLRGNNNLDDSDKLNYDQQSLEGYQMIKQLLNTCQMMSLNIKLDLFQENNIFQEYQQPIQQQQKQEQLEEVTENNQRKKTQQEKENQQIVQNQSKQEDINEKLQDKVISQNENQNNDDEDEIII
ncbi:unnamed protein product (macronuclear) [Paramecium tetraurelia]|uniref:C2 tensin-type domain-containing protein n=1 Tax=Paramecium tetraurelia TaxID=5888 RepID=A0C527_PARTE|nr:uncharacterized protein GSPATT00006393001 [Paramecium tetraurelia]CAK65894.1 unnamed protein product [Paramecium tetraurelia]|eukprot:XP_001433291.1 hypothetical protein (macronuclear) [Paramecium tetraurelia strain d4-2]